MQLQGLMLLIRLQLFLLLHLDLLDAFDCHRYHEDLLRTLALLLRPLLEAIKEFLILAGTCLRLLLIFLVIRVKILLLK